MSTFIAEHPLAAGICILLITAAFFLISVIVISCIRISGRLSREEEDDAFDYGALEGDLQQYVSDLTAPRPSHGQS
jgi:hypothetical protein